MTFSSITSNPAVCSWPGGGVTPGLRRHVLWHEYKCEFGYSELELLIEMPDEVVRKEALGSSFWVVSLSFRLPLSTKIRLLPWTYPAGGSCGSVPVQLYLLPFVPGGVFVFASTYDLRTLRIKEAEENDK